MIAASLSLPIYQLSEWNSHTYDGLQLCEEDRRLLRNLQIGDQRKLDIEDIGSSLRITTQSWIGVVRFSQFEVQVQPKLAGDNLGLVKLIDYALGIDGLHRYGMGSQVLEGKNSALDILIWLFVASCERLLKRETLVDYREQEEDLPVMRGQLLVDRQVLRRFGEVDRLECRYDEQVSDIPDNQILAVTLDVAARRTRSPYILQKLRRLQAIFASLCDPSGIDLRQIRRDLIYDRKNESYREPHGLAWLILDGLGIHDFFQRGAPQCFSFMLDMNQLFEKFLTRWIKDMLRHSEFRVEAQRRDRSILWDITHNRSYSSIIPDLLITQREHPDVRLPIDAKYKLYGEKKLNMGDIYQTFLYAFAYGRKMGMGMPRALLMYPIAAGQPNDVRLHVREGGRHAGAEIRAIGIHIPSALEAVRAKKKGEFGEEVLKTIRSCWMS